MTDYDHGSHTIHNIQYYFVWMTKHRHKVLIDKIASRVRELISQSCRAKGISIVSGSVGKDHVRILISCPTNLAPSYIAQILKGRSSRLIQNEFPELKNRYWGQHLWERGYFCATIGTITIDIIRKYMEDTIERDDLKDFSIEDGDFQS
ncbi:MAG: IS200/IS605 family transposase [Clostridiales bacterium]|jgi:putative transposase|nr:IS200/IS605 family transposase [Clostridiales bacterium]